MRKFNLLITIVLAVACSSKKTGEQVTATIGGIPAYKMAVERLPDMEVPRATHRAMLLNDELTVFGGHTDGFIPSATAEYYKDGSWHTMQMSYIHDGCFASILEDGSVMLGGGCAESFGIGQSWGVEIYHPESHSFTPLCIMDRKRTFASAANISDGVLVSGNWYADDAIELWTPEKGFSYLKEVSEKRSGPYILKSAPDNAIIFGGSSNRGAPLEGIIDRMNGEPYRDTVLDRWMTYSQFASSSYADDAIGEYSYLIFATRRSDNQPGILKVSGGSFSELETAMPIPTEGINGAEIRYAGRVIVDRPFRMVWLPGMDSTGVFYAVKVNYDPTFEGGKATMTVYYADISDAKTVVDPNIVLMPGGSLALTGGTVAATGNYFIGNNFAPSAAALILHTGEHGQQGMGKIIFILLAGALMPALLYLLLRQRPEPEPAVATNPALMARIISLMEEDEIFKKKGLTKSDVALALGTNVTYVSAAINTQHGCTFPEFVADYRVRYAQKLMRERKGVRLSDIGDEAGFSNEQTFFRTFKARTGLTPLEWKNQQI